MLPVCCACDPRSSNLRVVLKQRDNTIEFLYDHWILAKDAKVGGLRWSGIRDVLGWVD